MNVYEAWRSGKVNRMHTAPMLHRENVAEHTWGLLFLILRYWPEASREFLIAAIFHDAGEVATGDVPAHVKWANASILEVCENLEQEHLKKMQIPLIELGPVEDFLLTVFDKLDFCVSCHHEVMSGNRNAKLLFTRSLSRAEQMLITIKSMDSVVGIIAERAVSEIAFLSADWS